MPASAVTQPGFGNILILRPSLGSEKPTVPRNTMGTLTLSNSDFGRTSIFLIVLYKSCAIATPKHSGPPFGKLLRIAAFAIDLRIASFHVVTGSLHHSTTVKLMPLLELINNSYPSLGVPHQCWEVIVSLVASVTRNSCKVAAPVGTSNQRESTCWRTHVTSLVI